MSGGSSFQGPCLRICLSSARPCSWVSGTITKINKALQHWAADCSCWSQACCQACCDMCHCELTSRAGARYVIPCLVHMVLFGQHQGLPVDRLYIQSRPRRGRLDIISIAICKSAIYSSAGALHAVPSNPAAGPAIVAKLSEARWQRRGHGILPNCRHAYTVYAVRA